MGHSHKANNATFNMWVSVSQLQAGIECPRTNKRRPGHTWDDGMRRNVTTVTFSHPGCYEDSGVSRWSSRRQSDQKQGRGE